MSDIDSLIQEMEELTGKVEVQSDPTTPDFEPPEVVGSGPQVTEDGLEYEDIPFSALFWPPTYVPDHLCRVYSGLEGVPDLPATYIPDTADVEMVSLNLSVKNKIMSVGPTGCGKTLMYEFMAAKLGRPFLRIEFNEELTPDKVFGRVHVQVDEDGHTTTEFVDGPLTRAAKYPTLTLFDEVSRATGYINIMFQRVLDRGEITLNEIKEGIGIKKLHHDFIIAGTDNTKGNGDDMDKYLASNVQDQAFINRFDGIIEADYLPMEQEAEMIKKLSPDMPDLVVERLATFSSHMHRAFKDGNIGTAFSPRNLTAITRLYNKGLPIRRCIDMNFTSRVSKSELSDVTTNIEAIFG